MDIVEAILQNDEANGNSTNSSSVEKSVDVEIDEGSLALFDYNALDVATLKRSSEEYLESLTRENTQLLINKIWTLPTERMDEAIVAKLPKPNTVLPRGRAVPKPRAPTKWQQFAREKGIRTKKKGRSKLKWDEELRKWIPTFSYQRVKAQEQKDWVTELGDNSEPKSDDPRKAAATAKQERTAKNELQRLRNLARAKNIKLPRVGLPSTEHFRDARQIANAVTVARASTASVGKFQSRLPKEKDAKDIAKEVPGLKRKRKAPPLSIVDEKKRNIELVENLTRNKKKDLLRVDVPSAPSISEKSEGDQRKRSTGKKTKGTKSAKKPKGAKGSRDFRTRVHGRKRRN